MRSPVTGEQEALRGRYALSAGRERKHEAAGLVGRDLAAAAVGAFSVAVTGDDVSRGKPASPGRDLAEAGPARGCSPPGCPARGGARKRPTWIFFLRRCRSIQFRDFRVVDAARWTTRFSLCEKVIMSGLVIENDLRAANSDGMHFTSCRDVLIADCVITSGDDCIAITTYGDDQSSSSGTLVTNCVFTSHSAGIRIGYGKRALLEDVTISNCVFCRCNRGIGIFAGAGAIVRHISISKVQMSTRLLAGSWWGKAEPLLITTLGAGATIEDVNVANVSARSEQGIVINASPEAIPSRSRQSIGPGPESLAGGSRSRPSRPWWLRGVVVGDVFSDDWAEMVLAQQHELAEALALRAARRQADRRDPGRAQKLGGQGAGMRPRAVQPSQNTIKKYSSRCGLGGRVEARQRRFM